MAIGPSSGMGVFSSTGRDSGLARTRLRETRRLVDHRQKPSGNGTAGYLVTFDRGNRPGKKRAP